MTPDGWDLRALGDLVDVAIGGTPARNNPSYWDAEKIGGNRWVAISDLKSRLVVDTSEYISDLGVRHSNVKLVPRGTTMMSFKLSIGRTALAGRDLYTNEAIAAFHVRGPVDSKFLLYALPRAADEGGDADVAVKGKTLNKAKLVELPLLLPPLGEQRKIAAILSSVDDAIETTQAVIDQLGVVKKAMMAELLTRGLPGRHTRFKQTEIGEVPESWDVLPLGELASVDRGKFTHRPRNEPRFFGGSYPFVQTGDVAASGGRIAKYTQTLNEDGLGVSKLFPQGTIIVTIAANIGDTAIAMFPVAFPDSLVGIQVGARMDNRFVELVLRTRKKFLEEAAPQSAQKNINLETLRPLLVQVPTREEQGEIADGFDATDARMAVERQRLAQLGAVKSALMSVLLTGEVRVKLDEEAA